jgi:hypothetical protein
MDLEHHHIAKNSAVFPSPFPILLIITVIEKRKRVGKNESADIYTLVQNHCYILGRKDK